MDELSEQAAKEKISQESIVKKFQFYGFLKNLQFFEPFLLIILLQWGLNLFEIGLLFLVEQSIAYILEIPSGIMADNYGKRTTLLSCFIFYIISFIFYFFGEGPNFTALVLASMFYGLGEAFRSGAHKAMEMQWLDKNGMKDYKSLLYGRTRAWSLYGSALNGILAILLVFLVKGDRFIFLASTVPFLIDYFLIASYPDYMNERLVEKKSSFFEAIREGFKEAWAMIKELKIVFRNPNLRRGIGTSTFYDAIFKTIKDYIQPIIQLLIGVLLVQFALDQFTEREYTRIFLGLIYVVFYIISSFASRNAYKFQKRIGNAKKGLDVLLYVFAGFIFVTAILIWIEQVILIFIIYTVMYTFYNLHRPLTVDFLADVMPKAQRTTILSIEAQFKALLVIVFAPLFGFIAVISIPLLFILLSIGMVIVNYFFLKGQCKADEEFCV